MDYLIQQLSSDVHAFKTGCNAKFLSDRIKDTVYKISEGCRMTHNQARKLEFILHEISSDQALKWVVYDDLKRKLRDSIYRAREEVASSFYAYCGKDPSQMNGINFKHDVYIGMITKGTTLYQWCKAIIVNGKASLYDEKTNISTVGEYFCFSKVPQEQLGLSPYYDLTDVSGKFLGTAKRECYKFCFPFDAECMLSAARGTYDNWNNMQRYASGKLKRNSLGRPQGMPLWTVGGQQQVYIPLGFGDDIKNKKRLAIELAKIAQPA